jgi:cytochrome c biogenesis protein CcmG/thiol:disulfide interchange protein DsbE
VADGSRRPSSPDEPDIAGLSIEIQAPPGKLSRGQLLAGALALFVIVGSVVVIGTVMRGRDGQTGIGIISVGRALDLEPRPAPDFVLTTYDGQQLQLSDFRGQVVVLNFWASWCPPCRAEAPILEQASRALRDAGVVIIGIDVWDDDAQAQAFLNEFGITYLNAEDTTRLIPVEYGVTGLPETFVVDRRGVLVRRWVGPLRADDLSDLIAPSL